MNDDTTRVPKPSLSFWMDGQEAQKLCRAARTFWQKVADAAIWPARQCNPLECSLPILDLIAWQRCIARYPGEPERLYRLRVAHAYANAVDAGQTSGWGRIFRRLELGAVGLEERVPGQDWDRVGIVCDDSQFPDLQNVLEIIVEDYGRTCRRYYFVSRVGLPLWGHAAQFEEHHETVEAARSERYDTLLTLGLMIFDHNAETMEAQL